MFILQYAAVFLYQLRRCIQGLKDYPAINSKVTKRGDAA